MMNNQLIDADDIEEKCSICGSVLKMGQGRFRTPDQVLCIDCYSRFHPADKSNEGKDGAFYPRE